MIWQLLQVPHLRDTRKHHVRWLQAQATEG